jgi:hypothetical protein
MKDDRFREQTSAALLTLCERHFHRPSCRDHRGCGHYGAYLAAPRTSNCRPERAWQAYGGDGFDETTWPVQRRKCAVRTLVSLGASKPATSGRFTTSQGLVPDDLRESP